MDEPSVKYIPRMRTVSRIVAEIKALDPSTEVSEYFIRQLIKAGTVPVVWAGNKALINLDDVLEILRTGTTVAQASPPTVGGIRRVDEHMHPAGVAERR